MTADKVTLVLKGPKGHAILKAEYEKLHEAQEDGLEMLEAWGKGYTFKILGIPDPAAGEKGGE